MSGFRARVALVFWLLLCLMAVPAAGAKAASPEITAGDGVDRSLPGGAHPVVPGFERFLSEPRMSETDDGAVRGGRLLLGELNCTSCHQGGDELNEFVLSKQAPVLDTVGSRVTPEFLRAFLADPHGVKPGTTMPDLFAGLSPAEKEEQVEALVHLLASTGSVRHTIPDRKAAGRGETLFHQVGCVACHGSRKEEAEAVVWSVPLGDPAAKYSVAGLSEFLHDPLKVRPSGRMPNLNLSDQQARELASYFLQNLDIEPNLRYAYFEGNWQNLPDFDAMEPQATGLAAGFDAEVARRATNFGLRFEGFLHIPREGDYTFYAGSDDGSKILIDGRPVVVNDGRHPFSFESGKVRLPAGVHPIVVDFFQAGGEYELRVEYEGPGLPRQPVADAVTLTEDESRPEQTRFTVDAELAAKGRTVFARAGCASCHQLKHDDELILSDLVSKPLRSLKRGGEEGCIAAPAPQGLPDYRLSGPQRSSLKRALAVAAEDAQPLKKRGLLRPTIARTMTALNCYACHQRDEVGGVEQAHNALFETTMPEMGDEGRIPPHLDGIGDKLTSQWLTHVLAEGADDRPYMLARMPKFGLPNVEHLVEAFEAADAQTLVEMPEFEDPAHRVKATGRLLVGEKALSCIKCHNFDSYEATGIQATDLTRMTRRLRRDWFHRYMVDPQSYRRGTRMPSAWPNGRSVVPGVLDGDTDRQLTAIWEYLSDGNEATVPLGLVAEAIELVPRKEPIIYRNFLEGVGPRGIGVGYPEGANLAFDADTLSLALIWHGAFIDASRHWSARGQGFQPPLGDHVLSLGKGRPFARLENAESPWPEESGQEADYRFRGYRLDEDRRPTFRYSLGTIEVEDFSQPVPGPEYPSFDRTLTLKAEQPVEGLWFRAAAGEKIEPRDDGSYVVDEALTIRIEQSGGSPPVVRKQEDEQYELLVPVTFRGNEAMIEQQYVW